MIKKHGWVKYILLLCAAVFIAVGATGGEAAVVFHKAIRICLECIGIG